MHEVERERERERERRDSAWGRVSRVVQREFWVVSGFLGGLQIDNSRWSDS